MEAFVKKGALFIMFLAVFSHQTSAQVEVNVLVLYDQGDFVGEQSVNSAISYLEQNPQEGVTVNMKYMVPIKKETDIEISVNATCDIMDGAIDAGAPPHVVLDLVKTGVTSETAKSFTRALGLPTFSCSYGQDGDLQEWKDLTDNEKNLLVQVVPPGDIIVQSIRDIVKSQSLTNAAIIFDDSFVMDHKYKSLLQNLPSRHIIVRAEDSQKDLRNQMKRLREADLVNFFVSGTSDTIRAVLDAATANFMFGRKYSWFTLSKGLDELGCGCENSTIVYMRPSVDKQIRSRINLLKGSYGLDKTPEVDSSFYFDFTIRGIKAAGSMLQQDKYQDFNFLKCSAFDETNPPNRENFDFRGEIEKASVANGWASIKWGDNGMAYPEIALSVEKDRVVQGKVASVKPIGKWDPGMPGEFMYVSGVNLTDHKAVTVYQIVTVPKPPFIIKSLDAQGKSKFTGYTIDLIEEIAAISNFQYELYEPKDGMFGVLNDAGEWNGMVRELVDRKADIALGTLSVMAERENVIDFTVPYYDLVGISIMMKKSKVPTSLFKFLTVLEPEVWLCILAAYCFTSVLLWIFDRFSPYSYQNNKEQYLDDDEKREFSLKECLWFCMTSLTPQGGGEAPKCVSGRMIAATWWLFGFIIIASYTANLAAFLTVSRLDVPIGSLNDLALQYKLQFAPSNGSDAMTYFQRMAYIESRFYEVWKDMSLDDSLTPVERAKLAVWDYPVSDKYTKMWNSMQEVGLPADFNEALKRVRASKTNSDGFAYLGDATDIRYHVLTNCDLQIIGDEFSRKPYALAVQQGSPLKDTLNDAILQLLNQRKLETLKEKWWSRNPLRERCIAENANSDGISLANIGGVFLVIFFGIILAIFTLAFEYYWYRFRKGARVSDSGKVLSVKQLPDPKDSVFTQPEKSNFNTEFRSNNFDIAPVPNPW